MSEDHAPRRAGRQTSDPVAAGPDRRDTSNPCQLAAHAAGGKAGRKLIEAALRAPMRERGWAPRLLDGLRDR